MDETLQGRPWWRRRATQLALLAFVVASLILRIVLLSRQTRRDHDPWAVALGAVLAIPIGAFAVWGYASWWNRRARRLRAKHPGSWVHPMTRGQSTVLLYLDHDHIKLVGLTGRVTHQHPRNQLTNAAVTALRFPLATRTGLQLTFSDKDQLRLVPTRKAGLASGKSLAEEAVRFLTE